MMKELVDEFNGPTTPLARSLDMISRRLSEVYCQKRTSIAPHKRMALRVLLDQTVAASVMLMCAEEKLTDIDGKRLSHTLTGISFLLDALEIRSLEGFVRESKSTVDSIISSIYKQGYDKQSGVWLSDEGFPKAVSDGIDRKADLDTEPESSPSDGTFEATLHGDEDPPCPSR